MEYFLYQREKLVLKKKLILKVSQTQVSTGLSDFYELILIVLKFSIVKNKPQDIQYRNYKYFDSREVNNSYLNEEFSREYVDSCSKSDDIYSWKF